MAGKQGREAGATRYPLTEGRGWHMYCRPGEGRWGQGSKCVRGEGQNATTSLLDIYELV